MCVTVMDTRMEKTKAVYGLVSDILVRMKRQVVRTNNVVVSCPQVDICSIQYSEQRESP